MKRAASAEWQGDLKSGKGSLTAPSGVLKDTNYSFKTRFEEGVTGTNPEELIAAAHAGCFAMALSHELATAGTPPDSVHASATVDLDQVEGGFAITRIHLDVQAKAPHVVATDFDNIAEKAKASCPVSKVLNAEITMSARLVD